MTWILVETFLNTPIYIYQTPLPGAEYYFLLDHNFEGAPPIHDIQRHLNQKRSSIWLVAKLSQVSSLYTSSALTLFHLEQKMSSERDDSSLASGDLTVSVSSNNSSSNTKQGKRFGLLKKIWIPSKIKSRTWRKREVKLNRSNPDKTEQPANRGLRIFDPRDSSSPRIRQIKLRKERKCANEGNDSIENSDRCDDPLVVFMSTRIRRSSDSPAKRTAPLRKLRCGKKGDSAALTILIPTNRRSCQQQRSFEDDKATQQQGNDNMQRNVANRTLVSLGGDDTSIPSGKTAYFPSLIYDVSRYISDFWNGAFTTDVDDHDDEHVEDDENHTDTELLPFEGQHGITDLHDDVEDDVEDVMYVISQGKGENSTSLAGESMTGASVYMLQMSPGKNDNDEGCLELILGDNDDKNDDNDQESLHGSKKEDFPSTSSVGHALSNMGAIRFPKNRRTSIKSQYS